MKKALWTGVIYLLIVLYTASSHAMLTSMRTALHTGFLRASSGAVRLTPETLTSVDLPSLKSHSFARTLAYRHNQDYSYNQDHDRSQDSSDSHRNRWLFRFISALTSYSSACSAYHRTADASEPSKDEHLKQLKTDVTEIMRSAHPTQTTQDFFAHFDINIGRLEHFCKNRPTLKHSQDFKNMIRAIISMETEEQAAGNYTFLHTYRWSLHCLQDIDAGLRSIVYGTEKQPLSLRFISEPNMTHSEKYKTVREKLVKNGASETYRNDGDEQKRVIFVNHGLFANETDIGSASLAYFVYGLSNHPPDISFEKIFKHLGLAKYYPKYKEDLEALQKLHSEASCYGAGILFSLTPEMLKKAVFVCRPYGQKCKIYIEGIGLTDDVQQILDTLRTAPEKIQDRDSFEFVFVVTKDCGLNPVVQESGAMKITPFNVTDSEKYALYEQNRNDLIAKIKADIDAEHTAMSVKEYLIYKKKIEYSMKWYTENSCLNNCEQIQRIQE